jgi:Glucodextranase, domain B
MRLICRTLACAASIALGGLAVAGCGTSTPAGPPQVTLSLTAPTSGATVGVRTVLVAGTVTPAHAVVRVEGKRVRLRHGSFEHPVNLNGRTTRIKIVARAHGYRPARVETTVHFSSGTARVMLLARRAATSVRSAGLSGSASAGLGATAGSDPLLGSAAGRAEFMSACAGSDSGRQGACACVYSHVVAGGDFSSRSRELATRAQINQAEAAGDAADLPASVRTAAVDCASQIYGTSGAGAAPS